MEAVQLELNIKEETAEGVRLSLMQSQIDAMNDSFGKVRRRLFAELGELKKTCFLLQTENENLKTKMRKITNEETQWTYHEDYSLFDVRQEAVG